MEPRTATLFFLTALACAPLVANSFAQDNPETIEKCPEDFMAAFNAKDNKGMQDLSAYPHVYSPPEGPLTIWQPAEEFVTDYDLLISQKGWARTDIDSLEVVQSSPAKAHVTVAFTSYNETVEPYQSSSAIWILVKKDDRWAAQLRSWLGPNAPVEQDISDETKMFLDAFFEAFNARDDVALQEMTFYPHAFSLHDGQLIIAQEASEMAIDFETLVVKDGWDHSTLDSYRILQSSPRKVHVAVTFSRHNDAGKRYHTAEVLYVLVNQGGRWGLQMRSVLGQTAVTLLDDTE